jgi:hypothetical protein
VEYSANYIGNDSCVQPIRDASGLTFVHYLIELDRFSVERYGDEYLTKLLVNGKVSDLEGRTIFQFERSIPVKLGQEQLKAIGPQKFSLGDVFPLTEGRYQLNILVKNDASKEFTSLETKVDVPGQDSPQMSALVLAYKAEGDRTPKSKAFKVGGVQLFPALHHDFTTHDNLIVFFQVFGLKAELKQKGFVKYMVGNDSANAKIVDRAIRDSLDGDSLLETIPLAGISPGYYTLKVAVLDEARKEVLSAASDLSIAQVPALPRPWVSLDVHAPPRDPIYLSILADQLFRKGDSEKALSLSEKAYRQNPNSPPLALSYGKMLFAAKDYRKVIEILTPLLAAENYESLELLARSSQALGEFDKAISYYREHLAHFGATFYILTFLGQCYYQTGRAQEALAAWEKSLELNPDQEEIRKIVEVLRKRR